MKRRGDWPETLRNSWRRVVIKKVSRKHGSMRYGGRLGCNKQRCAHKDELYVDIFARTIFTQNHENIFYGFFEKCRTHDMVELD